MKKRSIAIRGHATSISLEDPFWSALQQLASDQNMSVASLVTEIDANRQTGLSSAIRVYILESLQELISQTPDGERRPE